MHFGRMIMEDLVKNVKNDETVMMVNNEKFRQEQLEKTKTASKFPIFSSLENLSLTLKNSEADVDLDEQPPVSKQAKLQPQEGNSLYFLRNKR